MKIPWVKTLGLFWVQVTKIMNLLLFLGFIPPWGMNVHVHIDTLINRDNEGWILVLAYFRTEVFELMISKFSISSKILDFMRDNYSVFWKTKFLWGRYLESVKLDAVNLF